MARAALPTWYRAGRGRAPRPPLPAHAGAQVWRDVVDPGQGRVEAGESLIDAAVREVFEETGVPVRLDGILRVEHTPGSGALGTARARAVHRHADRRHGAEDDGG